MVAFHSCCPSLMLDERVQAFVPTESMTSESHALLDTTVNTVCVCVCACARTCSCTAILIERSLLEEKESDQTNV